MNSIIKGAVIGAIIGGTVAYCASTQAQYIQPVTPQYIVPTPFKASPQNFNNSPQNFYNSPYNFNNSPQNFNNSPYNYGATNRIYDSNGNPMGYTTTTPQGVTNYFDFNGNRLGYKPAQ